MCTLNPNTKSSIHSLDPCCGAATRCKITGQNEFGFDEGTCCIKNRFDGCTQDSDCCDDSNICIEGKCELDIPLNATRKSPVVPKRASSALVAPFASGPIINDNEYINHRNNKGKNPQSHVIPELWRKVSYGFAICMAMSLMLFFLFVAI